MLQRSILLTMTCVAWLLFILAPHQPEGWVLAVMLVWSLGVLATIAAPSSALEK